MPHYHGEVDSNITVAEGWTPFWFEGNSAWGLINGPAEWAQIKEAYPDTDLSQAKISESYSANTGIPYYGFRHECQGPKLLGEFFAENNMTI